MFKKLSILLLLIITPCAFALDRKESKEELLTSVPESPEIVASSVEKMIPAIVEGIAKNPFFKSVADWEYLHMCQGIRGHSSAPAVVMPKKYGKNKVVPLEQRDKQKIIENRIALVLERHIKYHAADLVHDYNDLFMHHIKKEAQRWVRTNTFRLNQEIRQKEEEAKKAAASACTIL